MSSPQIQKTADWIQHQFDATDQFPECEAPGQLHAYKSWTHTPVTDDAVNQWVEEWMSADEISALKLHIDA